MADELPLAVLDSAPLTVGGGYERFALRLGEAWAARGRGATIVTPGRWLGQGFSLAATGHGLARALSESELLGQLGTARWVHAGPSGLRRELGRVQVVYAKNEPQELVAARLRPRRVKAVIGLHSAPEKGAGWRDAVYRSRLYRRLLQTADVVHALSNAQRTWLVDRLGMDSALVRVLPLGVDLDRFRPTRQLLTPEHLRLLFVGRLTRQKGLDALAHAARLLDERLPRGAVSLTIVGDGALASIARDLSRSLPWVTWLGSVDAMTLYQAHDVLVVPSRWETFGMVAAEGAASGLALVVSELEAFAGYESAGAVRCPVDGTALADALDQLWAEWHDEPGRFTARRDAARRYAEDHLDERPRLAAIVDLLEQMADHRAKP